MHEERHRLRVVVGEGSPLRRGLLRFVLEREGFDVVGEARSLPELAHALASERPDAVVLDEEIGIDAPGMTGEMLSAARIVLVWPRGVVPIGADARVEPSNVLRELGPTVARACGAVPRPPSRSLAGERGDAATLRAVMARGGAASLGRRPSVSRLQAPGRRLHPITAVPPAGAPQPQRPTLVVLPASPPMPWADERRPEPDDDVVVLPEADMIALPEARSLPRRARRRLGRLDLVAIGAMCAAVAIVILARAL